MHASTNLRKHVHRYPKCMTFICINANRGLKDYLSLTISLSLFLSKVSLNNFKHLIICIIAKTVYLLKSLYGCMILHCVMHVKADDIYGFVFVEIHRPPFHFFIAFSFYVAISLFFKATKTMTNSLIVISQKTILP